MKKLISALLTLACFLPLAAQKELRFEDYNYEPQFRTVQFYRGTDAMSYPVLYLGDESTGLTIEFDELMPFSVHESELWVTVINCDENWEGTSLIPIEYIDGYTYDRIIDYRRSGGVAMVPYVHYKYELNPQTVRFTRSGNFLLKIYRSGDENDLVLTRRFIVADRKVFVGVNMGQSYATSQRQKLQRINFEIHPGNLNSFNPVTDLKVVVLQNGRWDNAVSGLQPQYYTNEKLEYQFDAGSAFASGNEYRVLDIRSTRFHTRTTQSIEQGTDAYRFTLKPELPRSSNTYLDTWDMNGNYFVEVQEFNNGAWEADYVKVKFALKTPEAYMDGHVYVTGKCFDWMAADENKMLFNAASNQYETEVLLKQGVYNYQFAFRKLKSQTLDETRFEGNHYQSENYYTILVYFTPVGARSPELVGLSHINYRDR